MLYNLHYVELFSLDGKLSFLGGGAFVNTDFPRIITLLRKERNISQTQAAADLSILIERGRRCMHLHLPDNSGVTIRALGDAVMKVLDEIERERAAE